MLKFFTSGTKQVEVWRKQGVLVALLLVALFITDAYATYVVFTSRIPGANDFYSRWAGARLLIVHGLDPYSDEATRQIQMGIYGRLAQAGEDLGAFAYPIYVIYMIFPLVYLPYPIAEAIWLVLLEFSLIFSFFLTLRLYRWQPPPWLLAWSGLWVIIFYHSARSILLGQFAIIIYLLVTLTLVALEMQRDAWAAVALAFSTVKPQMVFLLVPFVLLWALYRRRWRFILSFAATMTLLIGSGLLWVPAWIGGFLTWLTRYPEYTALGPPLWIITDIFLPFLGDPVYIGLSIMGLLLLLWAWWRGIRGDVAEFHWTLALTLLVTNLVVLRTATTNYVILYLPLFWGLKLLASRVTRGNLWVVVVQIVTLIGLWALFMATVVNKFEHPIMYLPLPLGLLLLLLAARPALLESLRETDYERHSWRHR
jgi:hypothetical protein